MVFDWHYTASLLFDAAFWKATWLVVELSAATWLIGIVAGFALALGKQSAFMPLRVACSTYIWLFRSLPLLVLLIFVYNLPQVLPWTGGLLSDPFWAGLLALSISEAAYIAEIHRGGLLSLHKGQLEAGKALGIRFVGLQRLIVLPQAFRVALPSLINEYVTIVKLTSLVSVISLAEILLVGERLYTQNFKVLETMLAVSFYYVLIVTVFGHALKMLEKHLDVTLRTRAANAVIPVEAPRPVQAAKNVRTARAGSATRSLEAIGIRKRYGDHEVLKGIDLTVRAGEVVSIIGPSGSGKTSLIRTLNGLETLDGGEVRLHDKAFLWPPRARHGKVPHAQYMRGILDIGMVFQSFNLFPHKTVLQNVTLAPRYHGRLTGTPLDESGMRLLAKVGMAAHAHKYPHQLSGGQQQRVAIARALAMQPSIVLFDEPTSALDPELVNEVLKVIEGLAQEGMTMIIVTHEINFAFRISDRIVFMEAGIIVSDAPPRELATLDKTSRIASFLKDVHLA
ncbi:Vitamin B12 import ATP-binding protein BtuD [Paraburkholderia nemoris]|uniref:amino acid ABC transporter permease/ATP-binding protein n=1 Tax=Paraburkholderia nemoris TaxID=2793076 RepID=UPI00190B7D29|nr:amino acid ABC transporter permease/ATP-binding protein [Paraburkholderia nemoris]MBK3743630.1 amino acid ABC transporter permease/ATP-binding protein [Paraburkholderia aspalathi]CAE6834126.1 Vitamin B12 import ATP-binding protein BtuD [Paraburkholderia nemoris]